MNFKYFAIRKDLDYASQFELASRTLVRHIRRCADIDDLIKITCRSDDLQFHSKGAIGEVTRTLPKLHLISLPLWNPVELTFDSR